MNFLTKIYEDNTEFQGYLNSLSSDNSSIYIHGVIKEALQVLCMQHPKT